VTLFRFLVAGLVLAFLTLVFVLFSFLLFFRLCLVGFGMVFDAVSIPASGGGLLP